jgi:hypothetical protein
MRAHRPFHRLFGAGRLVPAICVAPARRARRAQAAAAARLARLVCRAIDPARSAWLIVI